MKRKDLLQSALTNGENVQSIVAATTKKDNSFLKRTKQNIENEIEDLEAQLEERLSSQIALDKSVIETSYSNIKDKKALLELYKEFEEEYISE